MDYELAKYLKDEGFPQDTNDLPFLNDGLGITNEHYASCPGLEELIEACGNNIVIHSPNTFDVSEYYWKSPEDMWVVFKQFIDENGQINVDDNVTVYGTTLKEALARLWLELNKK